MVHETSRKENEIKEAINEKDIQRLRQLAITRGGLLTDNLRKEAWPILLEIDIKHSKPPLYNYSLELSNNNNNNNNNNNDTTTTTNNNNNSNNCDCRPHEYYEVVEKDVIRCLWKHSSDYEREERRRQVAAAVHGILQRQGRPMNSNHDHYNTENDKIESETQNSNSKEENESQEEREPSMCSSSMDELETIAEEEFGNKSIENNHSSKNNSNSNNNSNNNNNNNNSCTEFKSNTSSSFNNTNHSNHNTNNKNLNYKNSNHIKTNTSNNSSSTMLHYYQGFHEVVGVFVLTCGAHIGSICAEHVACGHLHKFMDSPSLRAALEQLNLLIPLIAHHEPHVGAQLDRLIPDGGSGLAFALPWILTWFAHVVDELAVVARLFDLFVASDPLMPLYFSAAIMCHFKSSIMEATDYPGVFAILARLPQDLPFEDLVIKADQMMKKTPPHNIGRVLHSQPFLQPLQFLSMFSLREYINIWGSPKNNNKNNNHPSSNTDNNNNNTSHESKSQTITKSSTKNDNSKAVVRPWQVLFLLSGASLATVMALYLGNKNI